MCYKCQSPSCCSPNTCSQVVVGSYATVDQLNDLRKAVCRKFESLCGPSGENGDSVHTAYWADDAARLNKVPEFVGQLGVQLDTGRVYVGTGIGAGDWEATDAEFTVVHNRVEFDAANLVAGAAILVIGDIVVNVFTGDLTVAADKKVGVAPSGKFSITTAKLTFHATPVGWGDDQWVFHGNSTSNGYTTPGTGLTLPRLRASADGLTGGVAGDVEGAFGDVPRRPEWFGAVKDDPAFDNTDAIVSAFKASRSWTLLTSSGINYWNCHPVDVKFSAGSYYHARTMDIMGCNFRAVGNVRGGTRITAFAAFDYANSVPEVCDFPQSNWINFTTDYSSDTETCYSPGHGMSDDDMVWVQTTGYELPSELQRGLNLYLVDSDLDTFKLSLTEGGAPLDLGSDGVLPATVLGITKIGSHQVRRKSIVYSQILFGGPVGVNTSGLPQTRDGGAFGNFFRFLYFDFRNREGYNTASLCAPNYLQENTSFENLLFIGGNFAQLILGARDRTQLDWFDCNGVRIEQCEFLFTSSQGIAGECFSVGSALKISAGRFVDISNCTIIGRTLNTVTSGTFTSAMGSSVLTTPTAHKLRNGDAIYFPDVGAATEIEAYKIYYIISRTDTTFRLTTRIHDTAYAVGEFAAATSGSWNQHNGCIATIDSKSGSIIVRSTHMESGVVGILIDSGGVGSTNTATLPAPAGPLIFWNATLPPQYAKIDTVDFNASLGDVGLRITERAELASVHVNDLHAIYNIGLHSSAPPLLIDDIPRGRQSHGIGSTYYRAIVHYVRAYAKELASPDGVKIGNYVATIHPDLMEPPPFLDPELFIGQPYVDIGGSVKVSLGANPALLSAIIDSFPLGNAGADWVDETGNLKEFTAVGTVIDESAGPDDPANIGDFTQVLDHANHLVGTYPADFDYGNGNAAFSFTVWVKFTNLSMTTGVANTVISKTGAGSVANTAFTGLGPDFVSVGHPFQDGNVIYLSSVTGYDLLEEDEPYVVLDSAADSFRLARYDTPGSPITCGAGTGATAAVTGGFELVWIGNTDPTLGEMRLQFPHPSAEYNAYYANVPVDPVEDEWTFYYGAWDPVQKTITLRNVTADSEVIRVAHDVDYAVTGGTFEDFVPLYDPNIHLRIGDRTNDANSGGDCHVGALVFYNRPLTRDECLWLHNWLSGRAFSEHT